MYSLQSYEAMIDDRVRMTAYAAALRAVISPTSVVLDLGAGTGIMSLLACRFGALRVYAIEPDDALVVARQNAAANGMSERITFLQSTSSNVEIPERADVVVADLRGVLPLFPGNIESMIHAREHLMAPGGVLIPGVDQLQVALVTSPNSGRPGKRWNRNDCGINLSAAHQYLVNTPRKQHHSREDLLTPPACWATIDYSAIESRHVENTVDLEVTRPGTATGICMWFETILHEDIGFSSGPGDEQAIYGMMFFPLTRAVDVESGDSVHLDVKARHHDGDYSWQWETLIRSRCAGEVLASFQQSTFFGVPLVAERLRKSADKFLPTLNEEGRITQFILDLMDGSRDNASIASAVVRAFPTQFPDEHSALTRVGKVCLQYC